MASSNLINLATKDGCSCNNNCIFCDSSPRICSTKIRDDTERVKLELYPHKHKKLKEVIFSSYGGEPTLRKDIIELISYANKLGYKNILLHSNGRMFYYPEFTKKVVDSGCSDVQIALHASNAELHDKITMTPGSFEQTVEGIKNLLRYKDRVRIQITVLSHKMNYKNLPAIARFISKEFKGTQEVEFYLINLAGTALENRKKLLVKISVVKPYLEKALAILERRGFKFALFSMPYCVIDKKYWKNVLHRKTKGGLVTYLPPLGSARGCSCIIFESCNGCIMKEKCPGTWESYASEVGASEFKPIKSR